MKRIKAIINYYYITLTQTKGMAFKWYNTSRKSKTKRKI